MKEAICGIIPLELEDIVCIDTMSIPLRDLGQPGFGEQLDAYELAIAKGLYQLEI